MSDFRDRWNIEVAHLAKNCQEVVDRLNACVAAYSHVEHFSDSGEKPIPERRRDRALTEGQRCHAGTSQSACGAHSTLVRIIPASLRRSPPSVIHCP